MLSNLEVNIFLKARVFFEFTRLVFCCAIRKGIWYSTLYVDNRLLFGNFTNIPLLLIPVQIFCTVRVSKGFVAEFWLHILCNYFPFFTNT